MKAGTKRTRTGPSGTELLCFASFDRTLHFPAVVVKKGDLALYVVLLALKLSVSRFKRNEIRQTITAKTGGAPCFAKTAAALSNLLLDCNEGVQARPIYGDGA